MLIAMGILTEYWRQSIGTQLLEAFERWAKNNDIYRLELTVQESNDRARALYEKFGFEYEGIKRDALKINGQFIDERYMSKLL